MKPIYKDSEIVDMKKATVEVSGRLCDLWPYDNCFELVGTPIRDENGKAVGVITNVTPGTDNPQWHGLIYVEFAKKMNLFGQTTTSIEIC